MVLCRLLIPYSSDTSTETVSVPVSMGKQIMVKV
jgi:hypothetical protein